mmetsp:Transcript_94937/g.163800  ORF Transcript_94937/g.163800 Transcript_94937/m.163800 type:complete len:207 (-) Transcript_94937:15201-15821(-)
MVMAHVTTASVAVGTARASPTILGSIARGNVPRVPRVSAVAMAIVSTALMAQAHASVSRATVVPAASTSAQDLPACPATATVSAISMRVACVSLASGALTASRNAQRALTGRFAMPLTGSATTEPTAMGPVSVPMRTTDTIAPGSAPRGTTRPAHSCRATRPPTVPSTSSLAAGTTPPTPAPNFLRSSTPWILGMEWRTGCTRVCP